MEMQTRFLNEGRARARAVSLPAELKRRGREEGGNGEAGDQASFSVFPSSTGIRPRRIREIKRARARSIQREYYVSGRNPALLCDARLIEDR